MKLTPKTIQIFLPDGDPRGIRIAEVTTRILQVIEVPRSLLSEFLKMPESDQVALYFLCGGADDSGEPSVYIGQTGDLRSRLPSHHKKKEFWERALVVISRTNSLTQTHSLFLEWYCIQAVRDAARYSDENGNGGSRPHTPAPLEADCLEIFETASTLIATLGYPLFLPLTNSSEEDGSDELFFCTKSEADARGLYTQEGFVVLKGSNGRWKTVQSMHGTSTGKMRQKLIDSGVIREEEGRAVFQKDHLFNSPSSAASSVMARNANGWRAWRDKAGKTLDELKRQSQESDIEE